MEFCMARAEAAISALSDCLGIVDRNELRVLPARAAPFHRWRREVSTLKSLKKARGYSLGGETRKRPFILK
jgi:hypothetical protein